MSKEDALKCESCKYLNTEMWKEPCWSCYDIYEDKNKNYEPIAASNTNAKPRCRDCEYFHTGLHEYPCSECFYTDRKHFKTNQKGTISISVTKSFSEDFTDAEIHYIEDVLTCIGRWNKKDGTEDLKKARQYLDQLIEIEDTTSGKIGLFDEFRCLWDSLPDGAKEYARSLVNDEKKESPKNGKYSMGEDDCFVPWNLKPHMTPPYTYPASGEYCCCESKMRESRDPEPNRPKDIVEIIWTEFCRVFCEALKEVSKEEKEKKDEE